MKNLKFWVPVVLWAGIIFSLSSLQVTPASEIYWQDFVVKKAAHLVEYAVFFTLVYRAFLNTSTLSRQTSAWLAFALTLLYGISDEYHQSFTPGREPKMRDVIIDSLGGGVAWLVIWKYLPKAPEKLRNLAKVLQID